MSNKKEFYEQQSHEQLVIFCLNSDYIENDLRRRLFLITGCHDFGRCDGMNGSCVECQSYERCRSFREMEKDYNRTLKQ